jgi:eukaryotic-like serine/threonine-protein kinase
MDSERFASIEAIYHQALDQPLEARVLFLEEACGGDDDLLSEVGSLLTFSDAASNLIDTPPMDIAAELIHEHTYPEIVGTTIEYYRILSKIGSGGMGDVFLAEDTRLERKVAIKFIRPEFAEHTDQVRRFVREAKMASSLNHPNIITVHEIGTANGLQFIATEFIEGVTLRQAMHDRRLTFGDMLDVSVQAATALKAAYKDGIFHRDIKPENIMLRSDGLVKVLDFGLAKLGRLQLEANGRGWPDELVRQAVDMHLTSPGLVMGTAAYMSPEQAQVRTADARSDVWSLGVVMFEMFTGSKPFSGAISTEMIASILRDEPAPIAESLPPDLRRTIQTALAKDPDDRFQNAGEMLAALVACRNALVADAALYPEFIRDSNSESSGASRSTLSYGGTSVSGSREHNTSSAEYIVSGVRQHKMISIAALTVVLAAIAVTGYFLKAGYSQPITSIAVMPFVNESGDPGREYLSDGISESMINGLSALPGVKVIARSSTFNYRGKQLDIRQVADELGVEAILTGSVSQDGDTLRVRTELVNVSDQSQIWGGTFDRSLTDVQQIQDEILRQIAGKLGLRLTPAQYSRPHSHRKVDPRAYELFLKGSFYRSIGSENGANRAADLYNQAIAIDPNYAGAYAALARTYLYLGNNGFEDQKEMTPKAEAAARRALELDEANAEVHLALAAIKNATYDWKGADLEFNRALELNPNLAAVHSIYSFFLVTQGRYDEAISKVKRSRDLDPLGRNNNLDLGYIHHFARQYDIALYQYNIAIELWPDNGPAYYLRGLTYAAMGRHEDALLDFGEMQRLNGEHTGLSCYRAVSLAKIGKMGEAKAILRSLEKGEKYVSPVELAILYAALGERDKSLASLERAYAERDSQMQFLTIEPNFDVLRNEPRFARLVSQVGFGS